MPDLPTPDQITDLFAKLRDLPKTPGQRALLAAIIKVARDVTDDLDSADNPAFSEEFDAAFEPFSPSQMELLIGVSTSSLEPDMIVRGVPLPPDFTWPAAIVWSTPPNPASGHTD